MKDKDTVETHLEHAREVAILAELESLSKSSFLVSLSHRLREPMNGIIGMLNLLSETELTEKQRKYMDSVNSASQQLLDVVKDVTRFSSMEKSELVIENERFNLLACCQDIVKFMSGEANAKNIALLFHAEKDIPQFVISDELRLKQVLGNLISNGVYYTDKGSVLLNVKLLEMKDNDTAVVEFKVKDTGVGIDADHLAEIYNFESAIFSKHEKQVSLELAVCRHIIEEMGGKIDIWSEESVGSTFTITLPIKVHHMNNQEDDAMHHAEEPPVKPVQKLASYEGIYSLVAEDDPINQILAQTYIKRLGGKVDVVGNGELAVQKFKENDYDIIFMDCEMPVMDGFDAALKIRELEGDGKHVPIVAMTAYATRGDRERCMAAKMDGHIAKPATIQALESVLREFLVPDHFEE